MDLIQQYNESNAFGRTNNLDLKVVEKGHIEYTMKLEEKHLALDNVVHGGAIAGLMDAVLSVAAFSAVAHENQYVATVEFKINYVKAVRQASTLKGIGKLIKKGRRLLIATGEIFNDSGELVALGTGTMMPVQNEG